MLCFPLQGWPPIPPQPETAPGFWYIVKLAFHNKSEDFLHKFSIKMRKGRQMRGAAMHGKNKEQGFDEKSKEIF